MWNDPSREVNFTNFSTHFTFIKHHNTWSFSRPSDDVRRSIIELVGSPFDALYTVSIAASSILSNVFLFFGPLFGSVWAVWAVSVLCTACRLSSPLPLLLADGGENQRKSEKTHAKKPRSNEVNMCNIQDISGFFLGVWHFLFHTFYFAVIYFFWFLLKNPRT